LVAGVASGLGILDVGFFADDWMIIGHLERHGTEGVWTETWLGSRTIVFFRPLQFILCAMDLRIFGPDAFLWHVHHLAWHVATVLLVFGLARQLTGNPRAAVVAALLFAWNPYHAYSLGWLSSRTGTVAATCTLAVVVAWIHWRRGGGWWAYAVALLAAVFASLTKETGFLAFLGLPLVDVCMTRRSLRGLSRDYAPFVVAGAALFLQRWWVLGNVAGGYHIATHGSVEAERDPAAMLDAVLGLMGGAGVGDITGLPISARAAGLVASFGILGGALLFRLRRPTKPRWPLGVIALPWALLGLQLLLILALTDSQLLPLHAQRWYGSMGFLAVGLGMAAARSRMALGFAIGLLAIQVTGTLRTQEVMRATGRITKAILDRVEEEIHGLPPGVDAVFVSGLPPSHQGLYVFSFGFEDALSPPLRERVLPCPVYPVQANHRMQGFPDWPSHPPVEAWLALQGRRVVQLSVTLTDREGVTVESIDSSAIDRAAIKAHLAAIMGAPSLALEGPPDAGPVTSDRKSYFIRCTTEGLATIDIYMFIPGKDIRHRMPVDRPVMDLDIMPPLHDLACDRGVPTESYLVVVGWPEDGGRPRFSPFMTLECLPR
jgi:hypothetical protein